MCDNIKMGAAFASKDHLHRQADVGDVAVSVLSTVVSAGVLPSCRHAFVASPGSETTMQCKEGTLGTVVVVRQLRRSRPKARGGARPRPRSVRNREGKLDGSEQVDVSPGQQSELESGPIGRITASRHAHPRQATLAPTARLPWRRDFRNARSPRLPSLHLPGVCLLRGTGDASNPGPHRLTALSCRTATGAVIWNFCDFMTGREESSIVPGACHPPAVIRALDSGVGVIETSAMRQYARKASDGV